MLAQIYVQLVTPVNFQVKGLQCVLIVMQESIVPQAAVHVQIVPQEAFPVWPQVLVALCAPWALIKLAQASLHVFQSLEVTAHHLQMITMQSALLTQAELILTEKERSMPWLVPQENMP